MHIENRFSLPPAETLISGKNEVITQAGLKKHYNAAFRAYFSRCAVASSVKKYDSIVRDQARNGLFRHRIAIEKHILENLNFAQVKLTPEVWQRFYRRKLFGESKKQGLSFRLPLTSCQPTSLCADRCYGHDALDATSGAIIRGCLNGFFASAFEEGDIPKPTLDLFVKEIERVTRIAIKESEDVLTNEDFERGPRIRFAHLGELPEYPKFADFIGESIFNETQGKVRPVLYTRHRNAKMLNQQHWVCNFTLDATSQDREKIVPSWARKVGSAFNGATIKGVAVNFMEHHRFSHASSKGEGPVCPATEIAAKSRTCDGNKCDLCFRPTAH